MPYIVAENRALIDPLLTAPIVLLQSGECANVSYLMGALRLLIDAWLPVAPRYGDFNEVIGVLGCMVREHRRRMPWGDELSPGVTRRIAEDFASATHAMHETLAAALQPLAEQTKDWDAGELNYVLTRLVLGWMADDLPGARPIANVAIQAVQRDWYRDVVTPYEAEKIAQNGDVYPAAKVATPEEPQ